MLVTLPCHEIETLGCALQRCPLVMDVLGVQVILVVSVLVPLLGLGFAYWSFGKLWG
jgi:hypothetical protein